MFSLRDRVWSIEYGWGVIEIIDKSLMPVGVRYDKNKQGLVWYDTLGMRDVDGYRTLFFEEIRIPESALRRPTETAEKMLEACKEIKFTLNDENYYIYFATVDKLVRKDYNKYNFVYGVKYISKEDAENIVENCEENNMEVK